MKKSITKQELCLLMGISNSTLKRLLNILWHKELSDLGYSSRQRLLPPKIITYIKDKWGGFDKDDNI